MLKATMSSVGHIQRRASRIADFEKCLRWLKQKQMERSGLHEDGYLMSGGDGGSGSSSHGSDTSFDSAS